MSEVESLMAGAREAVVALRHCIPDEHEIPDAVGHCRELEVILAEWRRTNEKRFDDTPAMRQPEQRERAAEGSWAGKPVAQGKRYELVPTYKTTRTYNTPRLLTEFQDTMGKRLGMELSLSQVIVMLSAAGALEIRWKWTQLQQAAKQYGLRLLVGKGESVGEESGLDDPMVGEVKERSGYQRVALKDEEPFT